MEIEPLVNDQKRKILAGQPNGDNVVKRAKLDLNSGDLVKPVALIETGDQENEIATSPATEPEEKMEPELELVKVETDEPEITLDEIRRLKEILRQEDAKLQLIKKIKATMIISDPKKPKIEAKIKLETGIKSGIRGATGPVVTVRIPKPSNATSTDDKSLAASRIASGLSSGNTGGRSNSPMTDSKATVQSTAASYERNRQRKDLLKQQLNRTLKEITQAPPPPSTDVNFFPSATNNEFLVLLGLELCVNRIKRDENKDAGADAYECAECGRDFSPAWKFDPEGRRLCQKCFSNSQMKDLTTVQQGKFADFKSFWNEKEQELKEIDYQLQKDEEAIRAQRLEAERERSRREQERIKRERERITKEKEAKAAASMSGWNLNQKALMQEILQQQQRKQAQSSGKSKNDALTAQLAQMTRGLTGGGATSNSVVTNLARQLAEASNTGANNSQEQILRHLTQLAASPIGGSGGRGGQGNLNASTLQSIHTQILKQELLRRQEKLRKEREDAARTQAMEQLKLQQRQLEEARRQQQQQQQQQQAQQNNSQSGQAALIRQLIQFQQLVGNNQRAAGSSSNQQLNQQLVNEQLANLLKNSDPATLRTLQNQLQNQSRGKN